MPISHFWSQVRSSSGGSVPPPPEEGLPLWNLKGNPSYSRASPTDKLGRPITGDALTYLNSFYYWLDNPTLASDYKVLDLSSSDDEYLYSRPLRDRMMLVLYMFRITGDLELLNHLVNWASLVHGTLAVGWRNYTLDPYAANQSTDTVPWKGTQETAEPNWSPYLCFVNQAGGFNASQKGTDLAVMNEAKWHSMIMQLMYTLSLNVGFASPNGQFNYQTEFDKWWDYVDNHFIPKWSGGNSLVWHPVYKGRRQFGSTVRATTLNDWPFVLHGTEAHSTMSHAVGAYYYWKLTGNESAYAEFDYLMTQWLAQDSETVTTDLGPTRIWSHNLGAKGSTSNYGQGAAYCAYEINEFTDVILEESHPSITEEVVVEMSRAVEKFLLFNTTGLADGDLATAPNILGGVDRGTMTAGTSSSYYTPRTVRQVLINNYGLWLLWEHDNEGFIETEFDKMMSRSYAGGNYSTPKVVAAPVAKFLKAMGVRSYPYASSTGGGGGDPAPSEVPLQTISYSNVGQVNPYNVNSNTPFVQSVAVPLAVNVPKGTYGVRIGSRQLAAQAQSIMHRPNGNARVLRVEGVWPSDITSEQTISLTPLPPNVTSEIGVDVSSGSLRILRNGVTEHTISPYAATSTISGSKPSNLKGSNSSASYVPKQSFHEWHVNRTGSITSVGAVFEDIILEENTPILQVYLARGRGTSDNLYEFQMRLVVYKYKPWVRWEFTTYKHFDVNLPGQTGSMDALAAERLTITPSSSFTSSTVKSTNLNSITLESNPYGEVSGTITGDLNDYQLNAVKMSGPKPLSVSICDFMGYGPSAIRATNSNLVLDFWSQHTNEVLDFRGTGTSGEVQSDSSDYNSSPRGTARTWEGFFVLEDNLSLAQKLAKKDDLWFMTPAAMESSEAFGPLKAAAGTTYAPWFKRVKAFSRVSEAAAQRHEHYGYAQLGLTPSVIPYSVNTELDRYVAKEPMHSGRYGQSKDSYNGTGRVITAMLTGDRTRTLRALQSNLIKADVNGHHGMILGTNYMGSSRDGVHRRYRDPWTGHSNDFQYFYPESQYTSYWAGGARRHLERATNIVNRMGEISSSPYAQRVWAWSMKYIHTNDATDLTKLNNIIVADTASSNNSWPPPSSLSGKVAGMMWKNFRYGHNTCPAVIAVYEATGDSSYLDDLALAYRTLDFSFDGTYWDTGMSSYGQHTTPFHALSYLRLRGYSASQVSSDAMNSMQFWIGDNIIAGTFRNHNGALPSGDPDTWTWTQILTYYTAQNEEGAGFQGRFGPLIASWYAS